MHRGNTNRHRVASSLYLPPQNDHPNPNNPDDPDPEKAVVSFRKHVAQVKSEDLTNKSNEAPRKMTLFGDIVGETDQNDQQDEKDKVTFILSENKSLTKRLNGVTKHLYEAECVNEELHHQVQALDAQLLLLKHNQIRKYSRTPSPTTTSFSDDIDQNELKTLKKEIQKLQLQQISDVNELKQQLSSSEDNVTLIKKKYNAFKRKDIENSKEKKYVEFKMQELENNCKTANANCKRWENKAKQFQNDIEELNSIRKSCALSSSTKRRRRRSSFGGRRVEKNELVLEHIIKIDPAESRMARPSDKDPFKIFTEGRNYKKLMI